MAVDCHHSMATRRVSMYVPSINTVPYSVTMCFLAGDMLFGSHFVDKKTAPCSGSFHRKTTIHDHPVLIDHFVVFQCPTLMYI